MGPGMFFLFFSKRHPFCLSFSIIAILMVLLTVLRPELTPRGTIAAFLIATCLAPALRKIDREHRPAALTGAALAVGFIFVATVNNKYGSMVNDSRFQLWRSAVEMVNERILTGYGPGRFEAAVQPHITKEYFFTEYAATHHPHPHNEFLLCISDFGICGAVLLLFFAGSALKPFTRKSCQSDRWLVWLFILLFLHGQVDVLLSTPLAGSWFLLCGGALSARGIRENDVGLKTSRSAAAILITSGALLFASLQFISGLNLRKAKIDLLKRDVISALPRLQKANELIPTRESRYIAGNVALFDLKRPDIAVNEFLKLEKEFCGGYIHSYGLTARALFAMGKHQEAKEFFALEREAFPYSALYAGFELAALQMSRSPQADIADAAKRFEDNLKLRDLDTGSAAAIQKNPEFDDKPLKWSKKP
jgi:tetratricopeptide (TPR) repeat protein